MKPHQIVIDANVFYAALRSRKGASFRLISLLPSDRFDINLSVPLILEYEDVLLRSVSALNFTRNELEDILDNLCALANRHDVFYLWRPLLSDPGDDLILELAVKANCSYIITFNKQDFIGVEAFDIKAIDPREFLQIIGEIS
ncbi:putative toxin-antitoxin system toxin component, PIN family [Cyclonatronum proteinivorum]|uniref:Putative toxin-antitoxin system toxin component, PIN family n=1 Tax=Cyclonatronum proteinivorum TaxID=1457365 RepID=A0A345UPR6_9BACT|nr:putative toxin-antitoxin system toxin component, PIN family [Cyclonatronum proteinivorum]AXJ02468.1 putative toxin-antitoxin system toxin component, PIN family [Cyclonatronum proteinivorum]